MKRYLLGLTFAVLVGACSRRDAASRQDTRPLPSPTASPAPTIDSGATSSAASPSAEPSAPLNHTGKPTLTDARGKQLMTELNARDRIMALAEVRRFVDEAKRSPVSRPIVYRERAPEDRCVPGTAECRWEFYVGDVEDELRFVWCRFYVDAVDGQIFVWDPSFGVELKTYDGWRRSRAVRGVPNVF